MADPYFDLANFSVNNELGSERDEVVLRHYFGSVDESKLATLALMKLVSEVREAMWAVVQLAISELEVDFVAYATERYERFEVLLAAMELGRLLVRASGTSRRGASRRGASR
jgi:thiamine kinase-like enzyme